MPSRDRLLDAWRGLSVLMVVVYHAEAAGFRAFFRPESDAGIAAPWFTLAGIARRLRHLAIPLIDHAGGLGVQFFFVISGYIITALLIRDYQQNGRATLAAFYVRRAFRILPPLWLLFGAVYLLAAGGLIARPREFLVPAVFLCNVRPSDCDWFLSHTWSLAIEEQFYLIWPVVLVAARFRSVPWIALAGLALFTLAEQLAIPSGEFRYRNGLSAACLCTGALYASSPWVRTMVSRAASLPAIALVGLLLFGQPLVPALFPGQLRVQDALTPISILFLIFSVSRYRPQLEGRWIVRALASLGLVSYGVYLWQQLFLAPSTLYPGPFDTRYLMLLPLVVLLSYSWLEKPLIRRGARLSARILKRGRVPDTPESGLTQARMPLP